jgi:hypothetical protein
MDVTATVEPLDYSVMPSHLVESNAALHALGQLSTFLSCNFIWLLIIPVDVQRLVRVG